MMDLCISFYIPVLISFQHHYIVLIDFQRASPRYESAYAIFTEIGDKFGLMQVLYGMAKTTFVQQDFEQVYICTGSSKINVHLETES